MCNSLAFFGGKIKEQSFKERNWELFTWPNQDDRMNMTEIGEHDRKIDNDEH